MVNFQKIRTGLFIDFDKVVIIEYEAVKEFVETDSKLHYALIVHVTLENGNKISGVFVSEMDDNKQKSLLAAEKECEKFVSDNFMKK